MKGGGGGGSTRTSVDYPSIWSQQYWPLLQDLGQIYQQQSQNPLHPLSDQALSGMAGIAQSGSPGTDAARGSVQDILRGGGFLSGGGRGSGIRGASTLATRLMGGDLQNPALSETRRIAMGGDVGRNPWLEETYKSASRPLVSQLKNEINPEIDIAAASGQGEGLHALLRNRAAENTTNALTDLRADIYGGAYESDQNRRMAALGQYGQLGQQGVANRLSGAGLASNIAQQGVQNTLQASGMAPGLDAARYADLERLYGIGQQRQQAPWQPGIQFANILGATPGIGGGSRVQEDISRNPFADALGGGLGGALLGSQLGGGLAGWTGVGGGLGGLLGLLSDERAKEDVEPVGITFDGLPVYTYKYKHDPDGPAHMGVMAQDAAVTHPEAVSVRPDGLLQVDYSALAKSPPWELPGWP